MLNRLGDRRVKRWAVNVPLNIFENTFPQLNFKSDYLLNNNSCPTLCLQESIKLLNVIRNLIYFITIEHHTRALLCVITN
jgi:hypothetical protein